jgi:PAS domain S-box-containing protein
MRLFEEASLKRKQMLIAVITTGAALVLAGIIFSVYEVLTFREVTIRNLTTLAQVVGDNSSAALDFGEQGDAQDALAALRAEPNIVGACIYNLEGAVFAEYQRSQVAPLKWPPLPEEAGASFRQSGLDLFHRIQRKGEVLGTVYIRSDLKALYARSLQYAVVGLAALLGASLVALAFSWRLQRLVTEPVLHLAQVARQVATEQNYALRATKATRDELGELIDGFNEMLSEIQDRDNALRAARESLERRVEERTRELARSLTLLNATLESTADAILAVGQDGAIVCHNRRFAQMFQIPEPLLEAHRSQEVLTLAASRLVLPAGFDHGIAAVNAQPDDEVHDVMELKDGRVIERLIRAQRVGVEYAGCVLSFRDVTERRRGEIALRASEQRFRSVWESSIEAMAVTDAQGGIIAVNAAFCHLVERSREELVGHPFSVAYDPAADPQAMENYRRDFASGHLPPRLAPRVRLWNGEELDLEISNSFVELEDHGRLVLSIFRDVTEHNRTEAKLRQAQEDLLLASRRAGMAEIATNVLHNVGNVLNSVNTSAGVIADRARSSRSTGVAKVVALLEPHQKDLAGFFTEDSRGQHLVKYLKSLAQRLADEQVGILEEVQHLQQNIEHIKEIVAMQQSYARVSGVVELHSPASLIEDALRMQAGSLRRNQIEVVREFEPVPEILVDKHKLLQILVNLVSNAKYALAESSTARRVLTVGLRREDADRICISVRDNGVGIAPENLTRIFSHGFTTRPTGHGFGLHSGALATQEMGGTIRAHSDGVGRGALFVLELPVRTREDYPKNGNSAQATAEI